MVTTSTWPTPNRTEKVMEEVRQEIGDVTPEVAVAVRNASGENGVKLDFFTYGMRSHPLAPYVE